MRSLLILQAALAFGHSAEVCRALPKAIPPIEDDSAEAEFRAWAVGQEHSLPADFHRLWRADINNDGEEDWIALRYEGTGRYPSMGIFNRGGAGFKWIAQNPPWPEGVPKRDWGWYDHEANDFLVTACGKTYFVMNGDVSGALEGYLWEGGRNRRACDPVFTRYIESRFQGLYDRKEFSRAGNVLKARLHSCRDQWDNAARLKATSDLSVTAYRQGDYAECLSWTNQAKGEPGFDQSRWKTSILHNERLCATAKRSARLAFPDSLVVSGSDAPPDYLLFGTVPELEYAGEPEDIRSRAWRDAGVATATFIPKDHLNFNLRENLRLNLSWGKGVDDGKRLLEERYIVYMGCRRHSCVEKGLLWVDMRDGVSAFAINTAYFAENRECIAVGSRTLSRDGLPAAFHDIFKEWRIANDDRSTCAYFVDGTDRETVVQTMLLEAR